MKKLILAVAAGAAIGYAFAATPSTIQKILEVDELDEVAGTRIVCGKNPTSFAGGTVLEDYTVPAGKTLKGVLVLNAQLE